MPQGCHQAAIRCAIGLDLFAFVPEDGSPVTASEIAKAKEADRLVVGEEPHGWIDLPQQFF